VPSRQTLAWLREARSFLSAIYGPQTGLITVTIHNSHGQGVEFLLPPDDNGRAAQRSRPTDAGHSVIRRWLRPVEQAAFDAAGDKPLAVKALARKAGYKPGSYFSQAVTNLCRLGRLIRLPDGVQRAGEH